MCMISEGARSIARSKSPSHCCRSEFLGIVNLSDVAVLNILFRLRVGVSPFLPMTSSRMSLASTAWSASRTSSTRSWLLARTSSMPATSCGPLSWIRRLAAGGRRPTTSLKVTKSYKSCNFFGISTVRNFSFISVELIRYVAILIPIFCIYIKCGYGLNVVNFWYFFNWC